MTDKVTPNDDFDLEFKEATEKVVAPRTEEEVPEKYKGKSPLDIITMHQNAEKKISQLGNEIGQLRKLTDTVLELKKENVREPEPRKPLTVDEIFADPDQAIRKTFESSEVAKKSSEAVTRVDNLEKSLALEKFQSKHPSYQSDIADPTFQEWITANPARTELFRRADSYDVASADALWQMWGEYKELKSISEKREGAKERRTNAVRAGRTVPESSVDTEARSPIYSRAKLMELQVKAHQGDQAARMKINDPAFQTEMQRAYSEGRVR